MRALADLLFPPACVGCNRPTRGALCKQCLAGADLFEGPACAGCGFRVPMPVSQCAECRGHGFKFDSAIQAAPFEGVVRRAIHQFKYGAVAELALPLAELTAPLLSGHPVVTWVPVSPSRMKQRGIDHGKLLAERVSALTGLEARPLLRRVRDTAPQMQLDPSLRSRNMRGALASLDGTPDKVALVDDVFTTGATASEAARALKLAGASTVEVVSVARAGSHL